MEVRYQVRPVVELVARVIRDMSCLELSSLNQFHFENLLFFVNNPYTILYTLSKGAEVPKVIILTFKFINDPDRISICHSSGVGCSSTKMSQTLRGRMVKKVSV
jgi:hypothetical protein